LKFGSNFLHEIPTTVKLTADQEISVCLVWMAWPT